MSRDTLQVDVCGDCFIIGNKASAPGAVTLTPVDGDEMHLRCPHYQDDGDDE